MSEISPIDQSILDLLEAGRAAVEQETSECAARMHESALREDSATTIGGLLLKECIDLRNSFTKREEYYLNGNWFQRKQLEKKVTGGFALRATTDGKPDTPAKSLQLHIRRDMLARGRDFKSGSLFPQESELVDSSRLSQDWFVISERFYWFKTYHRVRDTESAQTRVTPLHKIFPTDDGVRVSLQTQYGKPEIDLEESEFFFPLGLVMEANRQVKTSVPARVTKKW